MKALAVHVLGVSGDAEAVAEQIAQAGHTVSGPQAVGVTQVAEAIAHAPGSDVVVVVGSVGTDSQLPSVVAAACQVDLPGYAERARTIAFEIDGAASIYLRPVAGLAANGPVFLVPEQPSLHARIVADLILATLGRFDPADLSDTDFEVTAGPASTSPKGPTASETAIQGVAHRATSIGLATAMDAPEAIPQDAESAEVPPRGWKRAVADLKAEVFIGKREDLPEPIEKLAPVVNVLHTAGEFGMMKLPSGRRYSLFGWPDLRRTNAKVLAVSWGDPLAEVIALHRFPDHAGTLIPGKLGILASQDSAVDALCEAVVGRTPPSSEGKPFAVDKGAVWILQERRVVKWDGHREIDDGNAKQVLASLTLHWSNL